MLKLGILDFGSVSPPIYRAENAIADVFKFVLIAEELGYSRYWLAEHFSQTTAWAYPELLLSLMAEYTNNIKIGIAGVLLEYNNPFQIACNFKLLSLMYPKRIDLGIARGKGPEAIKQSFQVLPDIEKSMDDVYNYIYESAGQNQITAIPSSKSYPDIWQLCSTVGLGFKFAVKYHSNLCVSLLHSPATLVEVKHVVSSFKTTTLNNNLHNCDCVVAVSIFCSNNAVNIRKIKKKVETTKFLCNHIIGNSQYVKDKLLHIQNELSINEFIVYIPTWEYDLRLETLNNLSEIFLNKSN